MVNNKKEKIGSIYYDKKDKKWKCSYYILDKESQKEKRKYKSFPSEQEAQEFLTSIQYQKGNDLFIQNNGIPLNQLMRENALKKLDLNLIGERSYARIINTIKRIEKSEIATKNIDEITSQDIQAFLNTQKNYSNSTIQKTKEQFAQTFREAINKGYITKNPMNDVIRPRSVKESKIVRALEVEEQQQLTNYLMNVPVEVEPYKVAYLIEMYLGTRIGETLALRSTDINLHKNIISINKTLTRDKNNKVIMGNTTKTYAGVREIPIPTFIRNEIINQMRIAENHKDKLLFVSSNGEYVRPASANDHLKKILNTMGITEITSHSLRHTFGTRCIEAGMRAVALQRLMGHTDVAITLNTYTSVFNKYKEAELEKVNDYYINNDIVNTENLLNENMKLLEDKGEKELKKDNSHVFINGICKGKNTDFEKHER